MTEAEFTTAMSQLNQLETERAKTHQSILASIAAARKQNETTKALQQQHAAMEAPIENLKATTQAYVNEQNAIKRKEAEAKFKAEAEELARKKAEEEKAREESALAKAQREIERLQRELESKG